MAGGFRLIQDFQHQYPDSINNRGQKNAFGGAVAMGIDIKGKKHGIGQQGQGANGSNAFVVRNKEIKKLAEGESPVTDKVYDQEPYDRAEQTQYQPEFEVVLFNEC